MSDSERPVAAVGAAAGGAALFSAAACCVLPLAFAVGVGAGGLASVVPYHWPLTILAAVAVGAGWLLHARKRRACARDPGCAAEAPARGTFAVLSLATAFVLLSALWPAFFEAPLMRLLGGA